MSYILDALRKSEQERLRGQPLSTLSHSPVSGAESSRPAWLLPLLVGNLVVFTVLGVWWLRSAANGADSAGLTAADSARSATISSAAQNSASASVRPMPMAAQEPAPALPASAPDRQSPTAGQVYVPLPEAPLSNADYEAVGDWQSGTGDMPSLTLTSHVYSSTSSARNVIINGTRLREGDRLDNGVKVLEITPTGARVSFKGAEHELVIGR